MRKWLLRLALVSIFIFTGCTIEEPGYFIADPESQVQVVDSDGDIVNIDSDTRAIAVIEYPHKEIHDGNSYVLNGDDHDLSVGQTFDLTVLTSNTTNWMHAVWEAEGTDAIHIFVYEGVTVNVPGTPTTPINRDRNSPNTSDAICREGDTFTNLGTLLWEWHTGDKKVAGVGGERDEYILRQGTQYLFRVESEVANNKVSGQLSWYEHTNLN